MDMIMMWVSAITLGLGALMGLKGMADPQWAARLVRLQPEDGKPEGMAEFRGTFGGMFLGLHVVALVIVLFQGGAAGIAVCWVLAAGWWMTAIGRAWARVADPGTKHPFVLQSIAIEVVAGTLIAAWPLAAG
jgi:hypothetical protein